MSKTPSWNEIPYTPLPPNPTEKQKQQKADEFDRQIAENRKAAIKKDRKK